MQIYEANDTTISFIRNNMNLYAKCFQTTWNPEMDKHKTVLTV